MSSLGFFRRRTPAPGGHGGRALDPESWQAGDWAECVVFPDWHSLDDKRQPGPSHGQVLRVIDVNVYSDRSVPGGRAVGLSFAGCPGMAYDASAFRKLRPRADEATPAEAEFTELVKRKPTPAPLPDQPKIEEFQ